jgi:hypothetical protein
MRISTLIILLTPLFAGSYQQSKPVNSESIPTVAYCELVQNPNLYSGKTVQVKATWQYGFEWSYLYDRECMDGRNHIEIKFEAEDELDSVTKRKLKRLIKKRFDNKADVVIVGKLYGGLFTASRLEDAKPIPPNVP